MKDTEDASGARLIESSKKLFSFSRNIEDKLNIKTQTCKLQAKRELLVPYTSNSAYQRSTLRYHYDNSEKKKKEMFKSKFKDIKLLQETLDSGEKNADLDLLEEVFNNK